jgi:hypothetical protein
MREKNVNNSERVELYSLEKSHLTPFGVLKTLFTNTPNFILLITHKLIDKIIIYNNLTINYIHSNYD